MICNRSNFIRFVSALCLVVFLWGCTTEDKPFSLVAETNESGPVSPGGSTPSPGEGGSSDACVVTFTGKLQLQVSSKNLKVVGSGFYDVPPIPFKFNGSEVVLEGGTFPDIKPYLGESPTADLVITSNGSGSDGKGTYDAASGNMEVKGFKLNVKVFVAGTTSQLGNDITAIPAVDFTTSTGQSASGNGDPSSITVDGQSFNPSDKSITFVTTLTLPATLGSLQQVDDTIGGGALTAVFKGNFDQDPAQCSGAGGGGSSGGASGGSSGGPSELSVSDGTNSHMTDINFGSTLVVTTQRHGKTVLDCSDAGNRGILTKNITITNTGDGDRKVTLLHAQDSDGDVKDPLCSGDAEFVRGSITTAGSASCTKVKVAGKEFPDEECIVPSGDGNAISFPLLYAPFNYVKGEAVTPEASPAATPIPSNGASVPDTGILRIQYDGEKVFDLTLKGLAEPDVRDSLAISRVKDGTVSKKLIRNGKNIKIAPRESDTLPFIQELALLNSGNDSYENVSFALEAGTTFTIEEVGSTALPAGSKDTPGTVKFKIKFSPSGSEKAFSDKLTIKMKKVGSEGEVTLIYPIQGIVGEKPIIANYLLQVDFLTAAIQNSLLLKQGVALPVESLDFRNFQSQAPSPQQLIFQDLNTDGIQSVEVVGIEFDPLTADLGQRLTALRILNAQGSVGFNGEVLKAGSDSSLCQEPDPIDIPYDVNKGCSYFYFNMNPNLGLPNFYDPETGDLTIHLNLQLENPYHGNVGGVWPPSNPNAAYPDNNILDTDLTLTLTTLTLDSISKDGITLVSDPNISLVDLDMNKREEFKGYECTSDDPITSDDKPHLRCYLTPDGKYLQGHALTVREGKEGVYDVILVGVAKFNSKVSEQDIPLFMDGSRIYIAIQGRICKDEAACKL